MSEVRHQGQADDVDDPGAGHGYDESPELDLTPRTSAADAARVRRRRPVTVYLALAAIVAAIGYVVLQVLGGATLYFRNVDEAVAQREELGTRRFRIQGTVADDVATAGDEVRFTLTFNGASVDIHHVGDPPDLFGPGRSVVLEGHFADGEERLFLSDELQVKHSEEYEAEHEERIVDAEDGESDLP